jgi:hypothetical protein
MQYNAEALHSLYINADPMSHTSCEVFRILYVKFNKNHEEKFQKIYIIISVLIFTSHYS